MGCRRDAALFFTLFFCLLSSAVAGMCRGGDEAENGGGKRLLMGFRWPIRPGSSPPTCRYRCGRCFPCRPVHVSIRPGVSTPLDYYPETWRCWCGNRIHGPCGGVVATMATANAVFKWGHRQVKLLTVDNNSPSKPPFPLLVATPLEGTGIFPVILFVHGYLLRNTFYSELIQQIASHGYIVVSPQLYSFAGSDANADCESTGEVIKWLSSSATMSTLLPSGVGGDMTKLTIAGHSRGGKVAFGVAQRGAKISAVIGIDPVDGMSRDKQTEPRILTFKPNGITVNAPVMVIGCGLSEQKKNALFPPCAPNGVNHRDFFAECRSPVWYFVAKDYGHLDMLDDDTKGFKGKLTYCLCKNGNGREPMRRFVGGIIVAFLNSQLGGDSGDFEALRNNPEISPVILSEVNCRL